MLTILDKTTKIQQMFEELLGSRNVYYQPPANIKMNYPAFIYNREGIDNDHANNNVYMQRHIYNVTVIDKDPDSEVVDKVSKLPACSFNRHFTADNLNHDVFILIY